jgi:tripartite-type tricarboxylate transporter receptor subunit TctC
MKRIAAFLAAASTSLVLATTLLAQSAFPVRTVKIIVPFPGGGINDVLARILAEDPIHFDIRHRQCGH